MPTFLFTWNPKKWAWTDIKEAVYETNVEGSHVDRWSCGSTRRITIGDRAFLMRLGVPPKGIIGSGTVISVPYMSPHWDEGRAKNGDEVIRVNIRFDVLSELPVINETELSLIPLQSHNWFPQASGTSIPDDVAAKLEQAWSNATGKNFHLTNRTLQVVGRKEDRSTGM